MTTTLPCRVLSTLLLALTAAPSGAAEPKAKAAKPAPKKPRVAVTISKETTRITEPLRKDGYPDYAAALNQRASKGVTPENNAAVLFWRATGPSELDEAIRQRYFAMLGIAALPEQGDYMVGLYDYTERTKNAEKPEDAPLDDDELDVPWDQQGEAMSRPWSAKEFPTIAGWVAANEKPLALVVEGTKRPRRYDPLVSGGESGADTVLAVLPGIQQQRELARLLIARAMLKLHEGKIDEAWADLLACHRLARLSAQGPTLIDALVGIAIDGIACRGDEELLQHAPLTPAQARKILDDLRKLPPMGRMVDKIDVSERFLFLAWVTIIARDGVHHIVSLAGGIGDEPGRFAKILMDLATRATVDWDVILRMGNSWYDRMVDAYRQPTRAEREEAFGRIDDDIKKLAMKAKDPKSLAFALMGNPRKAISERMGHVFVALLLPAITTASQAEDRGATQFELTRLGFALAAYRADHGSYPAKLSELAPKHMAEIPKDIFSAEPLRYKRHDKGYLLYSVGVNGKDDGGKDRDDCDDEDWGAEDWDDLSLRVPAEKKEKKQ